MIIAAGFYAVVALWLAYQTGRYRGYNRAVADMQDRQRRVMHALWLKTYYRGQRR